MLIVDDSRIDHAVLSNIFADDFIIEIAKDGNAAFVRLRHYGMATSVVLLDLMMPDKKYLSVQLADGSDVDPEQRYTIASWDGTVAKAYLTGRVTPLKGAFEGILRAKMQADETVAPANGRHIRLVWD